MSSITQSWTSLATSRNSFFVGEEKGLTSRRVKLLKFSTLGYSSSSSSYSPSNYQCIVACKLRTNVTRARSHASRSHVTRASSSPSRIEIEGDDKEDEMAEDGDFVTTPGMLENVVEKIGRASGSQKYLLAIGLAAAIPGLGNLEGPQSVLQALGVLAAIITVHEAGHFLAARLQGIHVTQFAIGFGPTLAKYKGKQVEYSLRAIPLGGFVAFPDDDPESIYTPDDPDLLKNRSIPERALVISAGVIANIMFAYSVLFGQVLTVGLLEQEFFPGVLIPEVIPSSAAARAGIQAGDVVAGVDGKLFGTKEASVFDLVDTIRDNPQRKLNFLVLRGKESSDEKLLTLQITPDRAPDGSGKIGVQLSPNATPHRVKAENLAEATVKATREFTRLFTIVTDGLKQVFLNFAQTADKLSGPVAIVAVGAEVARSDIAGLFQFAAIVNINLAVVNLLPLPALDGGYLFLIALEALRGKKLPDGVEQGIMSSGILLLLALGVVLMVRDTINLGIVQQML